MMFDKKELSNTVLAYRRIVNTNELIIFIDQGLHDKYRSFFQCVFSTYHCVSASFYLDSVEIVYVAPIGKLSCFPDWVKVIVCDTNSERWMFSLIRSLEEWYAERLDCTVIHASLITRCHVNTLFVGKRMAGKTTLTGYFSIHEEAQYLDDDCIYVSDGQYLGFNMPISLRNNVDFLSPRFAIGYAFDGEAYRTMFFPDHVVDMVSGVDVVIFPAYSKEDNCTLSRLDINDAFNRTMNQIRHSRNPHTLFNDILHLTKNSTAYSLKYNCSKSAALLLDSVLR